MQDACVFFDAHVNYVAELNHLALLVKIDTDLYLSEVGFGELLYTPAGLETGKEISDHFKE